MMLCTTCRKCPEVPAARLYILYVWLEAWEHKERLGNVLHLRSRNSWRGTTLPLICGWSNRRVVETPPCVSSTANRCVCTLRLLTSVSGTCRSTDHHRG